jgi:hypothetical protein
MELLLTAWVAFGIFNYGAVYAHRQWWSPTRKDRDRRFALAWSLAGPVGSAVLWHQTDGLRRGGWRLR